jgi:O-antigen/teichoic acid export membrane protein
MSTVQRIAKNASFLFLGQVIAAILSLVLLVFLARYLGDVQFGKYSFAFAFTSLFIIIADLGLNTLSIREIARTPQKASDYLSTISLTKLVLSLVMVGLIVIIINLMHYPQDTTMAVYIMALVTVLTTLSTFFHSIFRAFERMEYEALTIVAERVLIVGAAIAALSLGYGLVAIVFAILVAEVVACALTFIICIKKFAKPKLAFDFSLAKRLVKAALPFGMAIVFTTIVFHTDTVMLSIMKGDATVGWYSAAYRLVLGTLFLADAFIISVYPVLSRYFVSDRDSLVIGYEKALKFLAILAIPIGIGTTVIASKIIFLLYGADFANSVTALQILIWAASFLFVSRIVGYTLASVDRQIVDARVCGMGALLNVILNLILIPRFSYIGAGIASVVSQLFVFAVEFNYLQKHLHRINLFRIVLKPIGAALIMGGILYALDSILGTTWFNLVAMILSAIVIYPVLLYLFKAFDQQEINIMKDVFKSIIAWRKRVL